MLCCGSALATVPWASWTCCLGFPCMGIFADGADATEANACHRSSDESLLLSTPALELQPRTSTHPPSPLPSPLPSPPLSSRSPDPASSPLWEVADDSGGVKLFNCPCVVEEAPYAAGSGHCSSVSGVRFLAGDRAAVSSGQGDRAIILWNVVRKGGASRAGTAPIENGPYRNCMLRTRPRGPGEDA